MTAAAFYDLEGTLVSTNLVHTLGFYAKNQPDLRGASVRRALPRCLAFRSFAVTRPV